VIRHIAARLLLLIPTLAGVLAVTFFLLYIAPGDPVQAMVGERADAETIARLRTELHLDDPVPVRFARYAGGILRLDLGRSYITRREIRDDLLERFPATLQLAAAAMVFAVTAGLLIGIWGAWRPGSWPDRIATLGAYLGVSFPVYWVGLLLILLFAVTLRWLPPSGSGGLIFLLLPALTLGTRSVAMLARVTRTAMQEALGSDFVRTARAKGLKEGRVVWRHGLRNALLPIITVVGLDFGSYLTGSILTETIFAWPGVGRYVLSAIEKRDLPAIQGSILFLSLVFVLVNLVTDLLYTRVDPRVAYD
jgi:ABC-type dipeptide/oligopeptide/nickel transport system permease component